MNNKPTIPIIKSVKKIDSGYVLTGSLPPMPLVTGFKLKNPEITIEKFSARVNEIYQDKISTRKEVCKHGSQ